MRFKDVVKYGEIPSSTAEKWPRCALLPVMSLSIAKLFDYVFLSVARYYRGHSCHLEHSRDHHELSLTDHVARMS